jgi:glycosyltransferase involved in cell wall biosynthesis
MRVLNINDYDILNRRFNGYDIKDKLRERGVESRFIVWKKRSKDADVKQIGRGRHMDVLRTGIKLFERMLGVQNLLQPHALRVLIDPWYHEADIVHFQLIHNELISMWAIPKIASEKKVVWTVHDPWIITGHCIHPMECQRWREGCPECDKLRVPKITYIDMAERNFREKQRIIQGSDIHFVVASQWMRSMLEQSPIMSGKEITVIPFGIDVGRLQGVDRAAARRSLDIEEDSLVITFRSDPGVFKGTKMAVEALMDAEVPKNTTALTFAKKNNADALRSKFKLIDFGWAYEDDMYMILASSDIFVMPSIAESFGMMAIEAMACGVPVIAFEGTALSEIVVDGETGLLVKHGDVLELRKAIERLAGDPSLRKIMGERAKKVAAERYDLSAQARATADLYQRVMEEP